MRSTVTFATLVTSAILLTACSTEVKQPEPAPVAPVAKAPEPTPRAVETVVAPVDPLSDPKGALAKRSVYFDYDKYTVRDDGAPVVQAHSAYLTSHKDRKVVIQGNTDERGGREYNLALGQKRAEAVRKSLSVLGVADSQMEAVSFGKEKPKATGSNEDAWAENRRADIVYTAK